MRFANRQPVQPRPARRFQCPRRGFSLLELMVSIALVLIVILGINQVFGLSSRTVGAGQALSETSRDGRNAQAIFFDDGRAAAAALPDAPFLIIRSQGGYAFRNKADLETDADQNAATQDLQGNGTIATYRAFDVNERRHRMDQLCMFLRGLNHRQTGSGGFFVDQDTSYEAYVVYGHLAFLDNAGNPLDPGAGTPSNWQSFNPNNYFASQWILGRSLYLLNPAQPSSTTVRYMDQNANGIRLSPFSPQSPASNDNSETFWKSRYDLCQTSMDQYRQILAPDATVLPQPPVPWWQFLTNGNGTVPIRHVGDPTPPRPLNSVGAARSTPCFLRGCTQFIVEYAGDFCTQKLDTGVVVQTNTGSPPVSDPDGVVDFVLDRGPTGTGPAVRKVRWYGFPRDVNDDGNIDVRQDVVPLAHLLAAPTSQGGLGPAAVPPAWERWGPTNNYPAMGPGEFFVAAWGPDTQNGPKPTMIRITVVLDDPDGRIGAGQSFEYVLKLQ